MNWRPGCPDAKIGPVAAPRRWTEKGGDGEGTGARAPRWIVTSTNRHRVTFGCDSDPREEVLAGWLAVMEGDYWVRRSRPSVMTVRPSRHRPVSRPGFPGSWLA